MMAMDNKTLLMVPVLAAAGQLAGCATPTRRAATELALAGMNCE